MSVGYVGYPGNSNGGVSNLSQYAIPASSYGVPAKGPSLAATLSNSPVPAVTLQTSGTLASPSVSSVTGSGLMKAPDASNTYNFQTEASPSALLQSAGTGQGKRTASKVFWATIATYGAFLVGVAAILTVPALGKSRGRFAQFTHGSKDHATFLTQEKKRKFAEEYTAFKQAASTNAKGRDAEFNAAAHPERHHVANHDVNGAEAPKAAAKAAGQSPVRYPALSPTDLANRFVSTDKEMIEHGGWWQRVDKSLTTDGKKSIADGTIIGFHKKGVTPHTSSGKDVEASHGELRIAYDPESASGMTHSNKAQELKSVLGIKASVPHPDDVNAEHIVVVDPFKGRKVLRVATVPVPADAAGRTALFERLGIDQAALQKTLLEKKRIAEHHSVFTGSSWEDQYERQQGAPWVDAGAAKKQAGQVVQRMKEYGSGMFKAWQNAREGGNGVGRMLLSSTMLNAMLAATAATVALAWTSAPAPHKPHNESPSGQ